MRTRACKECGKARPTLAVEQGDEFCSTTCAKRRYGTMPARDPVIQVPTQIWRERLKRVS